MRLKIKVPLELHSVLAFSSSQRLAASLGLWLPSFLFSVQTGIFTFLTAFLPLAPVRTTLISNLGSICHFNCPFHVTQHICCFWSLRHSHCGGSSHSGASKHSIFERKKFNQAENVPCGCELMVRGGTKEGSHEHTIEFHPKEEEGP